MSVDRTDYIVYGWKLPYNITDSKGDKVDLYKDEYLPMVEGHKGEKYAIITDGMCGDYNVFGIVVKRGGDRYEGWLFENLDIRDFSNSSDDMKIKYREIFDAVPKEPNLFIFTHWS